MAPDIPVKVEESVGLEAVLVLADFLFIQNRSALAFHLDWTGARH